MKQLVEMWSTEEYQQKCKKAWKNRASAIGETLYTGGSIPAFKHMRHLETEISYKPRLVDLFMRTHQKRSTREFVDQRSQEVYLRSSQASATGASVESRDDNADDTALWLQAVGGKNKKGCIFGIGSKAC